MATNAKRCIPRDKAWHAAKVALPPIVGRGWVGGDRVGQEGWAKLGNGFAASVVAGKGAIDPYKRSCGRVWGLSSPMLAKVTRWQEGDAARAANGFVLPCWWWGNNRLTRDGIASQLCWQC
jgi:hypothetical protein